MASPASAFRGRLFRLAPQTLFSKEITQNDFDNSISNSNVVVLGEYHGVPSIVKLQTHIQDRMAESLQDVRIANKDSMRKLKMKDDSHGKVRVVLEHFSTEMQDLLNRYNGGTLDLNGLNKEYHTIGTEGHNLAPYIPSLEAARIHPNISIHGGFIPRTYARLLMKEGKEKALQAASKAGFISKYETLEGTDQHYNFFESLLTGRNIYDSNGNDSAEEMSDRFREKMFPAQIIKDASMAFCVKNLLSGKNKAKDKVLVVCGVGHMLHSYGVPERIMANLSVDKEKILRVACLPMPADGEIDLEKVLTDAYGGPAWDAADVIFLYTDDGAEEEAPGAASAAQVQKETRESAEKIQEETRQAYDRVGSSAYKEGGDMLKARGILTSLYYTPEEIDFAGADAVNYQGVGCPHRHANIQEGESVLDMGSGLGVDSLLAARSVGPNGRVVGVDLSSECVQHANNRAEKRGVGSLSFVHSPLENIGSRIDEREECFDAVISNGAFCLLPNKRKGVFLAYRLLKPNGRIAVCRTVIKDQLEDGVEWSICMQTFAKMGEIKSMLLSLGFEDVEIDLSDSLMEIAITEEEELEELGLLQGTDLGSSENEKKDEDDDGEGRFKVHNEEGRQKYRHLEKFDMNKLCARVVIKARKP
eukprot:CAMPEP_0194310140 /NCGR_PEP_ID=MMETSP0171-20130528/7069_1 /TAXON_ID=218684 /ORGANISM="Corethron pennatum, Strain L29A3" /LENGTH=644 /DNA_ID=CAMNT_0039063619 /DNA_START=155 /DNA_END=2089 /DNA_ORIENTATION=-